MNSVLNRRERSTEPEGRASRPTYEWHSLDVELRALPLLEEARKARERGTIDHELEARIETLVREDRREWVRQALAELGAVRVDVERAGLLQSLIVFGHLRVYVIRAAWGTGVFTKHAVEQYDGPIPQAAMAVHQRVKDLGLPVEETVVFEEVGIDPYLAVRFENEWLVLSRWDRLMPVLRDRSWTVGRA